MKKAFVMFGLILAMEASAQTPMFTPGSLAVLRVGTGNGPQGSTSPFDLSSKQNPAFIDEFNVNGTNSAPVYTMPIPTNGNNSLWFNGNQGTEGNMARSADRSVLTWAGYSGTICSISPGSAPSSLNYPRGICVVTAFTNSLIYSGQGWYGSVAGKTNPRGTVSDGTNEFYGCGTAYGTLQFDAPSGNIYQFQSSVSSTRSVKIFNNTLYTTINGADGAGIQGYPAGIYDFVDDNDEPVPLPPPGQTVFANLVIPTFGNFTSIEGFDINPQGNVAYIADNIWGIQKYVKTGGAWRFACNYSVASFNGNDTKDGLGGVLDLTVDYSGAYPVIYATTAESVGYSLGNFNENRLVKIIDTNTSLSGLTITNVMTLAQAWNTNVGFHSVSFVPDLRPIIAGSPVSQSVVAGSPVSFTVSATESGAASLASPVGYQWLENGTNLTGQTGAVLTLGSSSLSASGSTIQCVVTNLYGSVTSAPPALLLVTAASVAPQLAAAQYLTNAIGDNVAITVQVNSNATTPLSYQWYFNGLALTEGGGANGEYSGTTNNVLQISAAQLGTDDGDYECVVTNIGGSASNLVATLSLVYLPPVFAVQPSSSIALSNSFTSLSAIAYGSSLSYQWYYNSTTNAPANFTPVSGENGSSLNINPAIAGTNYFVVVSNQGGSITSSVVTLTVIAPPASSYVAYTNAGQIYLQTFNTLPVATNSTYNTGNPVTITEFNGSAKGITLSYSLANPFDFSYPVLSSGNVGGLGLTNTMKGWYGGGSIGSKLGASQGDQSTGGIISFGTLSTNGVAETNRALGLLSTPTTGTSAFGLKLINQTTTNLSFITLKYLGEVWRNQPNTNPLLFRYYIDSTGTNGFNQSNALSNPVANLNVSFAPSTTLTILDGSQAANQISLGVTNLNIGNWPTNAALWLVWQQANTGSAQGLAIDNLSFSAMSTTNVPSVILPLTITPASTRIVGSGASALVQFAFTNTPGLTFSILATNNLTVPKTNWPVIGTAVESPSGSGHYQFNDPHPATNSTQFYILRQP